MTNIVTEDFSQIPIGMFLIRMNHEKSGIVHHVALKENDKEWYDQPPVPVSSEQVSSDTCAKFWAWAKENIPVFVYNKVVKSALN
jgi:hypothetical protein